MADTTLRDTITEYITSYGVNPDAYGYQGAEGDVADRILALVREALLSDEARRIGGRTLIDEWEREPTEEDLAARMTAALDAAGIVEKEKT